MSVKINVADSVKSTEDKPRPISSQRRLTFGKSCDVEDEYALFQSIDHDGDGFIPIDDLKEAIYVSGDIFGLRQSQIEELIRDVDINQDEKINFAEFCILLAKAKKMQMRRIVLYATQSVLGRSQQAEEFRYLTPLHVCSPPPIFIIIITIIQIAVFCYFNYQIYDFDQIGVPHTTTEITTMAMDTTTSDFIVADLNSTETIGLDSGEGVETTTRAVDIVEGSPIWYHLVCDPNINRDVIATHSMTKCLFYYMMDGNPSHKWQLWRAFTSMFLHGSLDHLVGNLAIQILLGIPLELVHKVQRIAPIYFIGGSIGHFLWLASNPIQHAVGASGAVYALVGAHVANVVVNWSEMRFHWIRFSFTILVLINVFKEFVKSSLGIQDGVGHLDHFGGFIGGFLLGICILKNIHIKRWEKQAKVASLVLFAMIIVGCLILMMTQGEA